MEHDDSNAEALKRFERDLAVAEVDAQKAIRRVESLRRVVSGLRQLVQADGPRGSRLFEVPSADEAAEVEALAAANATNNQVATNGNGDDKPRGREAVSRVLIETRTALKIPDLVKEIQARGWMLDVQRPRDAVAASVQRLVQDEVAERVGVGTYRYRLDKLPPAQGDDD